MNNKNSCLQNFIIFFCLFIYGNQSWGEVDICVEPSIYYSSQIVGQYHYYITYNRTINNVKTSFPVYKNMDNDVYLYGNLNGYITSLWYYFGDNYRITRDDYLYDAPMTKDYYTDPVRDTRYSTWTKPHQSYLYGTDIPMSYCGPTLTPSKRPTRSPSSRPTVTSSPTDTSINNSDTSKDNNKSYTFNEAVIWIIPLIIIIVIIIIGLYWKQKKDKQMHDMEYNLLKTQLNELKQNGETTN
mmetsp:Transcript_79477/g.97245  ORF Transcript_79477/g.97245 Transcript_79477/m.97245 type:complete len:241 (+) Transcript_79477:21-743(+)